jgi:hypothetical protein
MIIAKGTTYCKPPESYESNKCFCSICQILLIRGYIKGCLAKRFDNRNNKEAVYSVE